MDVPTADSLLHCSKLLSHLQQLEPVLVCVRLEFIPFNLESIFSNTVSGILDSEFRGFRVLRIMVYDSLTVTGRDVFRAEDALAWPCILLFSVVCFANRNESLLNSGLWGF